MHARKSIIYPDLHLGEFDRLLKRFIMPGAIRRMVKKLPVDPELKDEFISSFDESLRQVKARERGDENKAYVPATPAAKRLIKAASEALVDVEGSDITYPPSFSSIGERISRGENVMLVSNHEAGADAIAYLAAAETANPGVDLHSSVLTVAAHFKSFPVREAFLSGFDRVRVYNEAQRKGEIDREFEVPEKTARGHNIRAVKALLRKVRDGGRLIFFFPQGSLHKGPLQEPPDSSGEILDAISRHSNEGLTAFPSYVAGTERIFAGFRKASRGNGSMARAPVTVRVGEPFELDGDRHQKLEGAMRKIASVMPADLRGKYA